MFFTQHRKAKISLLLALLFNTQLSLAASNEQLEVRQITPPQLSAEHLGPSILCYRPMRQGTPAMNIQKNDGKIIVNNYGHGGSGWTLAPGAVKYAYSLLLKFPGKLDLNKRTPIAIVGAGALGLFTALELVNNGYKNITIIAESFDNLTSHNAGGLLAPVSMDNAPEMQNTIDEIAIESYKFYKKIANKKNKQLFDGATVIPTYFPTREESGLEPYVGKVMSPAKDVLVDFKNGTTHQMVVYDDGIFINTAGMMQSLTDVLKKSKVKFVHKKIKHFSEVEQNIIFNCSGNGAKELSQDDKMVSVQGHLIMLRDQNPNDLNYMMLVYFGKDKTSNDQDITRSFYIFPKKALRAQARDIGVIGGTFIENSDSSTPNIGEFKIMLEAAKKFYGIAPDQAESESTPENITNSEPSQKESDAEPKA